MNKANTSDPIDAPVFFTIMLSPQRLDLAIRIQSQSFELLRWIGTAIEKGQIQVDRAEQHSDTPDAAFDWIERNWWLLPQKLRPDKAHAREFANFFWTYVTTSFNVIAHPGSRLQPGDCGCMCPLCARIMSAPHLQPKKLVRADKRRADQLMIDRVAALAKEEALEAAPNRFTDMVNEFGTRRSAAFSAYGQWLINRLAGQTDGPAILAPCARSLGLARVRRFKGFRFGMKTFILPRRNSSKLFAATRAERLMRIIEPEDAELSGNRLHDQLIARHRDDRRRTTAAEQELPELRLDMFIRAFNEELDVFDYFYHRSPPIQRLRGHARTVAIVNTIVPSLEDFFVAIIHAFPRCRPRRRSISSRRGIVGRPGDSENCAVWRPDE